MFISCHGSRNSVNVVCIMLNINRVIKKSLVLFQFHSNLSIYGETLSRKYLEYHLDKKPVWKYLKKNLFWKIRKRRSLQIQAVLKKSAVTNVFIKSVGISSEHYILNHISERTVLQALHLRLNFNSILLCPKLWFHHY